MTHVHHLCHQDDTIKSLIVTEMHTRATHAHVYTYRFLSFNVKWPQFIVDLMLLTENVNFSVMTLPGLSCIFMGTSYEMKLLGYTIGPLFLYLLIVLPCALAKIFLGSKRLSESPWKLRYEAAHRTMMNNICFFSFLIYPMVSMTVLKGLQCRDFGPPIGALIVSDVSIVCPYGRPDGSSFLYYYTLVFMLIYPFGIPILLWLILKAYRIPQIATRKTIQSGLSVMIQMYMQETCDVCLKNLAAILWSEEKIVHYFHLCCYCKLIIRNDLMTVHPGDRNRKFKELLFAVMVHMDVTHDLNLDQFRKLVADVVEKVSRSAKEFKGPDTKMDMLTSFQMKVLIKHEFKCDRGELEAPEFSLLDSLQEEAPESAENKEAAEKKEIFADLEAGAGNGEKERDDQKGKAVEQPTNGGLKQGSHELERGTTSHNQISHKHAEVAAEVQPKKAQNAEVKKKGAGKKQKRLTKKERRKLGTEEQVEHLDKEGLKGELSQRILMLVKNGILALPPMAWDGDEEDEKRAVREVGSLVSLLLPPNTVLHVQTRCNTVFSLSQTH